MPQEKLSTTFYLANWLVIPNQNLIKNAEQERHIAPKLMDVLCCLCVAQPDIVSTDLLIETCWPNQFISDSPVHKCITQLRQALKDDAKKPKYIKTISKKGYAIIADVRKVGSSKRATIAQWLEGAPYLGIKSYQAKHQSIFAGRNKATTEIKNLIQQNFSLTGGLLILMGPHGVGKTSIIDAEIIPFLQTPDYQSEIKIKSCIKYAISTGNQINETERLIRTLLNNTEYETTEGLLKNNEGRNKYVIFIDQLERIVMDKTDQDSIEFLALFRSLVNGHKFLVVTALKDEYYAELMKFGAFNDCKKQALIYDLLPPDRFELTEIIRKPVTSSGLKFEYHNEKFKSLDNQIISEAVKYNRALSIISHVMRELCIHSNTNHELTFSAYEKMGGFSGFIAKQFSQIFETCSEKEKQLFEAKLHHLIKFNLNQPHKLYCAEADIMLFNHSAIKKLISELLNANLLGTKIIDGKTYILILDDALLAECDVFKSWITKNQSKLSSLAEIQVLHAHWYKHNQSNTYLIDNEYLLEKAKLIDLSESEGRFVDASIKKRKASKVMHSMGRLFLVLMLLISVSLLAKLQRSHHDLQIANEQAEAFNFFLLNDLKNKLKPIGQLDLLAMISEQILLYYDTKEDQLLTVSSMNHLINALNTMGEVQIKSGDLNQATALLNRADSYVSESLKKEPNNTQVLFQSSQNSYWLGYIHYLNKDWDVTKAHWQKYLLSADKLMSIEPKKLAWQLEYSYALNNLGTISLKLKQSEQATNYLHQSAQIKQQLVAAEPGNSQFIAELADTVSWQASLLDQQNNLIEANQLYQQSLALSTSLVKLDADDHNWQYRWALAYYRLANSYYDLGEIQKSKAASLESIELLDKLSQIDSQNHKWKNTLINNHVVLAKLFLHLKLFDDALWHVNQGKTNYYQYSLENQQLRTTQRQFLNLSAISSFIMNQLGQHKVALSEYQLAYEKVHSNTNALPMLPLDQAMHQYTLSRLHQRLKNTSQASTYLNAAKAILTQELKQGTDNKFIKALFLYISKNDETSFMLTKIKQELKSMKFNNPDYQIKGEHHEKT